MVAWQIPSGKWYPKTKHPTTGEIYPHRIDNISNQWSTSLSDWISQRCGVASHRSVRTSIHHKTRNCTPRCCRYFPDSNSSSTVNPLTCAAASMVSALWLTPISSRTPSVAMCSCSSTAAAIAWRRQASDDHLFDGAHCQTASHLAVCLSQRCDQPECRSSPYETRWAFTSEIETVDWKEDF